MSTGRLMMLLGLFLVIVVGAFMLVAVSALNVSGTEPLPAQVQRHHDVITSTVCYWVATPYGTAIDCVEYRP